MGTHISNQSVDLGTQNTKIGVYIHVPFCNEKCPYCDFYSLTRSFDRMDAYTQAVIRTIHSYTPHGLLADTLYFGGGTPSLLGAKRLGEIVAAARETFGLEQAEITVEVNPTAQEAWLERLFEGLFAAGVNRLSFGLQSANLSELQALGRRHTPEQAWNAVKTAQRIGFSNLSLDLMLAIPYQTKESLLRSIEFCAQANISHISAYLLKIEPDTSFFTNKDALLPCLPNEEELEALYLLAVEELERRGLEQYEISNFAKREQGVLLESRHNTKYWRGEEYLGIGPAAHGFFQGKRYYSPPDLDSFLAGKPPIPDGDGGGREEFAMLALRLKRGLSQSVWQAQFGEPLPSAYLRRAKKFVPPGLIRWTEGEPGFSLTPKGFLVSNALIADLLFGT